MVNLLMNNRALRRGLLIMCLISPVYGANNSNKGGIASMELLEYIGSLVETNKGLFGPDLFIENGISDTAKDELANESVKNQAAGNLENQGENQSRKEVSNENQ